MKGEEKQEKNSNDSKKYKDTRFSNYIYTEAAMTAYFTDAVWVG